MELAFSLGSIGLVGMLAVIGSMLLFASLLTLFLACKSRRNKEDDLNPLKGIGTIKYPENDCGHQTTYGSSTCNHSSLNLSPTKMIKVSSCYASLTSDSSSDEEENFGYRGVPQSKSANQELRIGPKGYIKTMTVQPSPSQPPDCKSKSSGKQATCKPRTTPVLTGNVNRTQCGPTKYSWVPNGEKYPLLMLTISLLRKSSDSGNSDQDPSEQRTSTSDDGDGNVGADSIKGRPSPVPKEKCLKMHLLGCENLKRSEEKENAFTRVVRRTTKGYGFTAEGVFARVYRLNDVKEPCLSRQSSGEEGVPFPIGKSDVYLKETTFVNSRKSRSIEFAESDSVYLSYEDFPLRISVYEMDKNKIRSALGHAVVNCQPLMSTIGQTSITLRLYTTVFDAIHNCCGDEIHSDVSNTSTRSSK